MYCWRFQRCVAGVIGGLLFLALLGQGAEPVTVAPQSGDGVYQLLRRHGFEPTHAEVEAFVQLNQAKLGPGNTLFLGRKYRLPPVAGSQERDELTAGSRTRHRIFGPKYEWVERQDNQLAKGVFYLVSGHGGPDPGAIGSREGHSLMEDEYAYDITLRLARVLLQHGATVHVIIQDPDDGIRDGKWLGSDSHETTHPDQEIPRNQMKRLRQRADAVNRLYEERSSAGLYHRVIVIHVDSRAVDNRVDVFFYHHRASKLGLRLARNIRDTFERNYRRHQPDRGYGGSVTSRGLFMLNATVPAAVFIELGNIRNRRNQYRFIDPENRQALAEWIAEGVRRDYRESFPQ
jgi:N-acetylmuramoyl-L-alanine amidase